MDELVLHPDFSIGEHVFFILGSPNSKGIVTAILTRGPNVLEYEVSWKSGDKGWYTAIELTTSNTDVL